MCLQMTPMLLASIGASAAGALYNSKMQNDAASETNRQRQIATDMERQAAEAERLRQREMEALQAAEVTKALFEADPGKVVERAEAAAADPENPIIKAADDYNVPVLTGQVSNKDVDADIAATVGDAVKRTRSMLKHAATLSGQGDAMSDAITALGRMGSEMQTIGSTRRNSANVARLETSVPAATVTRSPSVLGDLLLMGGRLGAHTAGGRILEAGGEKPFGMGDIFRKWAA